MSYDWDKICTLCAEVSEYAEMECNSYGEAILAMVSVLDHPDYISEKVLNTLVDELTFILRDYKDNCEVVKTEETFTHTVVDLVRHGYYDRDDN